MRIKFLILFAWVAASVLVHASEHLATFTIGNDTYTNVTITSVSATDVFFSYDHGMGNVKLRDLDPAWQRHFNYNPGQAKQAEQHQAAANALYEQNRHRTEPVPNKKLWAKSCLNQKVPELFVEKWLVSKPDCRGKFVLINFWATSSLPCRKAIPELNALAHKFSGQLVVIGLSDENEGIVSHFADPKIEYHLAIDTQARTKKTLAVTGLPHVLLIDPQGYVRWEGYPLLDGYQLTENVIAGVIARHSL